MRFLHVLLDSFGLPVRILSSNTPDLYANKATSRVFLSIIYERLWVLHIIVRRTNRSANSDTKTFPNNWFYLTFINLYCAALLMNINWNESLLMLAINSLVLVKQSYVRLLIFLRCQKFLTQFIALIWVINPPHIFPFM